MEKILLKIHGFVWGVPALVLIVGVGLYLSLITGFMQLRLFPRAVRTFFRSVKGREDGSFQALCTALAATVGTGNIAGVAGAIAIGGPGSIFWMWVCALLGMVTKCAEALLSVRFRHRDANGVSLGGPMYMIEKGMGEKWRFLAVMYSFFAVVAAFGMGNATQINAVTESVRELLPGSYGNAVALAVGAAMALATAISLLGGAKKVGSVAVMLVPVASAGYILLSLGALAVHARALPEAFCAIAEGAFSPEAVTGGMIGSAFTALRVGSSRGVFTNEAGMGTAAIAHGDSMVKDPMDQGLMGIMEVFLDTVVICTLTALVILTSGIPIPYGLDEGVLLTTRAFACTYGSWIRVPMALFLGAFAFATMLGWGLYGLRCAQYLFGQRVWRFFVVLQALAAMVSLWLKTGTVWLLSETVNGLMAVPNLICLAALSPELLRLCGKPNTDKLSLRHQ